MEYRSSNAGQHISGSIVAGVGSSHGVELGGGSTGGTVNPVGDDANISLAVAGKGTGFSRFGNSSAVARIGGSTTGFSALERYIVEFTPPAMAANTATPSTYTVLGLTTNAAILSITPRLAYSSQYAVHDARCSTADELSVVWSNTAASTIGTGESTGRWTLIAAKF